jgi:hypothetical protein
MGGGVVDWIPVEWRPRVPGGLPDVWISYQASRCVYGIPQTYTLNLHRKPTPDTVHCAMILIHEWDNQNLLVYGGVSLWVTNKRYDKGKMFIKIKKKK